MNSSGVLPNVLRTMIVSRLTWLKAVRDRLVAREWYEGETLQVLNHGEHIRYVIMKKIVNGDGTVGKKRIYANKKMRGEVIRLAQRDYDRMLYKRVNDEIEIFSDVLKQWEPVEQVFQELKETHKMYVKPLVQENVDYISEWQNKPYEGLPFSPEDTSEFYTAKGERVRSKSEVMIADTLYRHGIPYKYECPITLKDRRTKYPDFTVLNVRTRNEYIWEHLGMMTDPVYVDSNLKKLKDYERNGIIQGDKLILTMESHGYPLSTKSIEKIIETFLV
jgi:hypothetical protein